MNTGRTIEYDIYRLDRGESAKLIFALIFGLLLAGFLFYSSWLPAAGAVFFYLPVKKYTEGRLMEIRKKKLRLQFRDFLNSLSASFASGRHMREGMKEAEKELLEIYTEKDYLPAEITGMLRRMEMTKENDAAVWSDFARRASVEEISDFVQIYLACRESGGDLPTALNKTSEIISEKITIENEIGMMVSQKRLEGRLITLMPAVIILFLRLTAPDYLDLLYNTIVGKLLMTAALAGIAFAYYLTERITDIHV